MSKPIYGNCIGCLHDFATGPCGGCGALRDTKPNPGSPEAQADGCTCAVLDNACGRGYMGQPNVFVMSFACPLHGRDERVGFEVGNA